MEVRCVATLRVAEYCVLSASIRNVSLPQLGVLAFSQFSLPLMPTVLLPGQLNENACMDEVIFSSPGQMRPWIWQVHETRERDNFQCDNTSALLIWLGL